MDARQSRALREKLSVLQILTNVGIFDAPPELKALYHAAPKTKSGRVDKRFKSGKDLLRKEMEFVSGRDADYAARVSKQ